MRKFSLCQSCASRFRKSPALLPVGGAGCYACAGALSAASAMVESAVSQASHLEWNSFSVASSFPKQALVREQELADYSGAGSFTSIKNAANSLLASAVALASGKENDQRNADVSFVFDFSSARATVRLLPLYVFGRYVKLSRRHCQSRWHCSDCGGRGCASCGGSGRNYPSVEDELGKPIAEAFGSSDYTLHASGREDVDVRMLGTGRPFVLEIRSPKKRRADLQITESRLAASETVRAVGLRRVGKHFLDAVCNSHFEKEYSALVSAGRPLSSRDAEACGALSGATLEQQTPKRVLSRRADLERKRRIFSLSAEACGGGKLRLRILAEAGTYIKELVSSDGGRTRPSVSGLLGCSAVCEELDVVSIRDYFLETIQG